MKVSRNGMGRFKLVANATHVFYLTHWSRFLFSGGIEKIIGMNWVNLAFVINGIPFSFHVLNLQAPTPQNGQKPTTLFDCVWPFGGGGA